MTPDKQEHSVKGPGLTSATALVMGSVIGSGIFTVSSDVARQVKSPGLLILCGLIGAALTILAALNYGEFAAATPHAGGRYVYLNETHGDCDHGVHSRLQRHDHVRSPRLLHDGSASGHTRSDRPYARFRLYYSARLDDRSHPERPVQRFAELCYFCSAAVLYSDYRRIIQASSHKTGSGRTGASPLCGSSDKKSPTTPWCYPALPALYMLVAAIIEILLLWNKPTYRMRGLILVLPGVPVYYFWRTRTANLDVAIRRDTKL